MRRDPIPPTGKCRNCPHRTTCPNIEPAPLLVNRNGGTPFEPVPPTPHHNPSAAWDTIPDYD